MKKLLQVIRLLTVACYFLPFTFLFVTCSGNKNELFDFAYNKKEAAENEIRDKDNGFASAEVADTTSTAVAVIDTSNKSNKTAAGVDIGKKVVRDTSSTISLTNKSNNLLDGIEKVMIKPSDTSETALGVIFFFYKTPFGTVIITVSLLLSLTIFFIGCFKKHNKQLVFVFSIVNLLCIAAFMADALVNSVQLLYGAWLCAVLNTLSVALQYRRLKGRAPVKLHRG